LIKFRKRLINLKNWLINPTKRLITQNHTQPSLFSYYINSRNSIKTRQILLTSPRKSTLSYTKPSQHHKTHPKKANYHPNRAEHHQKSESTASRHPKPTPKKQSPQPSRASPKVRKHRLAPPQSHPEKKSPPPSKSTTKSQKAPPPPPQTKTKKKPSTQPQAPSFSTSYPYPIQTLHPIQYPIQESRILRARHFFTWFKRSIATRDRHTCGNQTTNCSI
jgi:hypothetical protein